MSITLGIDVGISTTKIVGFENNSLIGVLQVQAMDQLTSMFGAIGNFLMQNKISPDNVSAIVVTGAGSTFIDGDIYGINTRKVEEFQAIGHGGLYLANLSEAFVVSLGTGTAFIRASAHDMLHIGGSGVGGGTLIGLSTKMLGVNDIETLLALASQGNLENVDLTVREILNHDIPSLPPNLTASNFGKIKSNATNADFALGIINMVLQTVGMLAVFAARNDSINNVVLTGTLTRLPQIHEVLDAITDRFGVNFLVPPNATFATAIGAAIPYI